MNKIEYKLFKTKQATSSDSPQFKQHHQNHFYVLVEFVSNLFELKNEIDSIWFNRQSGEITAKKINSVKEFDEIGKVYGYIGKFQINSTYKPRLLFIKKCDTVGSIRVKSKEHVIYKIKEVLVVTLTPYNASNQEDCLITVECDDSENSSANNLISSSINNFVKSPSFQQLLDNPIISVRQKSQQTENITTNTPNNNSSVSPINNANQVSKFEKKILDEIVKIFQEYGGSFYYSFSFDLTNSIERQEDYLQSKKSDTKNNEARDFYWARADDRFFWNKILLKDLIQLNNDYENLKKELITSDNESNSQDLVNFDKFILPLMQGFLEIETIEMPVDNPLSKDKNADTITLKLCLISRRNRYRLGTRFKSRGIDESGNVSNFVETEQIIDVYDGHTLSSVLLRGSIPVYWSQPGYKYRPPPQLDRNEVDNKSAIETHFNKLEKHYPNQKNLVIINLVEEFGKESVIGDAYVKRIAELDRKNLTYVQFDFHEHCKGLKFDNVSILKDKIKDLMTDDLFCWVDNKGFIFKQKVIFRINCVDCLDRTNVVQMVIAKSALETKLARLGLIIPPAELPAEFKKRFLSLWANNGDAISQQYAGTDALKGDYTRTGERNFTGMMKDGMKSANRFYLRFKYNNRQMALECLQGIKIVDDEITSLNSNLKNLTSVLSPSLQQKEESTNSPQLSMEEAANQKEREENVRQLVADCKRLLVDLNEDCYGNWALIDSSDSSHDQNQLDPDTILLFTSSAVYVANYNETNETISDYQKIDLDQIEKLELGPEQPNQQLFFKTNTTPKFDIMRIYYKPSSQNEKLNANSNDNSNETEYFHSFRSCNLRFFNNLVITTTTSDEMTEALRGICHTIQSTAQFFGYCIPFDESRKLSRKKSRPHQHFVRLNRLSSKMSIDFGSTRINPTQFNSKLNKIGKIIGNKIYNMVNQNQQDLFNNNKIIDAGFSNYESSENSKSSMATAQTKQPSREQEATSDPNLLKTMFESNNNDQITNNMKAANRSQRLKELNKLIEKSSHNTKFIFI